MTEQCDLTVILDSIGKLAENRKAKCPQWHIQESGICMTCERYKTESPKDVTPPNPAYAPLLNLVRERCQSCLGDGKNRVRKPGGAELAGAWYEIEAVNEPCQSCHGTGYVTRRVWEELPPCALIGALEESLWQMAYSIAEQHSTEHPEHQRVQKALAKFRDYYSLSLEGIDPRPFALETVKAVIE